MHVLVLGSAAGGGFPQWNCRCPVCSLAWEGSPRVRPRTQSTVAVSVDGASWVLLNASPDLRAQILAAPQLHPQREGRSSPIESVILSNADLDHVAGLLALRENHSFALHASAEVLETLDADPVFRVLNPSFVRRIPFRLDHPFASGGLHIVAFAVPGKRPLFFQSEGEGIGSETEMTVGLDITSNGRRFVYIPGCAHVTDALRARLAGADLLFFDGTTFTDDELPALGLSSKTAARMGHMAMIGESGSLNALAHINVARKVFIHLNNTNPVLIEDSPQRRTVEASGWEIAFDGMTVSL
ncbi:pyrroloquinoline quinone biosynthesis protein PqqB [Lichenifustis flavocetrariae]|uniref:Coenzyme PQQ synthesis protein B n=1 Tax=Lichenifustis flavocetrariae TaxID=2949735 RepID=A0AA41YZP4_9HYPH|nr:pyrroloquinoline quinone biosynthesis protein PqqB [Lichenifustis flavocetrariae]MCW6506642.1 pyrroloquinoline quinone biosynthesis protein PqqB [Lichenifustis flavocetrariae]